MDALKTALLAGATVAALATSAHAETFTLDPAMTGIYMNGLIEQGDSARTMPALALLHKPRKAAN